ncbi:hypothetical protein MCBRY_000077 [Methylocystis bryophila]
MRVRTLFCRKRGDQDRADINLGARLFDPNERRLRRRYLQCSSRYFVSALFLIVRSSKVNPPCFVLPVQDPSSLRFHSEHLIWMRPGASLACCARANDGQSAATAFCFTNVSRGGRSTDRSPTPPAAAAEMTASWIPVAAGSSNNFSELDAFEILEPLMGAAIAAIPIKTAKTGIAKAVLLRNAISSSITSTLTHWPIRTRASSPQRR